MFTGRRAVSRILLICIAMLLIAVCAAYCDTPDTRQQPVPAIQEDIIKFDPNKVEAKQVGGAWKVVQGDMWMLDFGKNESQARDAARIIKFYKMDGQCFVGRPNPPMQYFLVDGKSPVGTIAGEDAIPFNPTTAEVKQFGSSWRIVDGAHSMLDFAASESNAKTALAVIRKYGFSYICFVGRPNAPMMYFRKDLPRLINTSLGNRLPGNVIIPNLPVAQPQITAKLTATPDTYTGKYPVTIKFKGTITAAAPCSVSYTFTRSDGGTGPVFQCKFDKAGAKSVEGEWTLSADYAGWETLKITSPQTVESNKAEFSVKQLRIIPGLRKVQP